MQEHNICLGIEMMVPPPLPPSPEPEDGATNATSVSNALMRFMARVTNKRERKVVTQEIEEDPDAMVDENSTRNEDEENHSSDNTTDEWAVSAISNRLLSSLTLAS